MCAINVCVCVCAGVNSSIKFYCEAKNARGVSVSRTGTAHIKGEATPTQVYVEL